MPADPVEITTNMLAVLGLRPRASSAQVKQAYRDLVKVWHPDRFAESARLQKIAEEKLKEINAAYSWLSNHSECFTEDREPNPPEPAGSHDSPKPAGPAVPPVADKSRNYRLRFGVGVAVLLSLVFMARSMSPYGADKIAVHAEDVHFPVRLYVSADQADIVSGPGADYEVVKTLPRNSSVIARGTFEKWYLVSEKPTASVVGWMSETALSNAKSAAR